MVRRPKFQSAAAMVAMFFAPTARALDPYRLLPQYMHERWTADRNYTGGEVSSFAQTPDGYLWIGAENGLVRFDGLNCRLFNHANTSSFPASGVLSLATDTEGNLWILLTSREVVCYRNGTFEPVVREAGATAMAVGAHGDLLLVRPAGTMRYRHGRFTSVQPAAGYTTRLIVSVAETADETVWMGTRDYGAFGLRNGKAFDVRALPDGKVNCLLATDAGTLWIGTDRGLARWAGRQASQVGLPAALRSAPITALAQDRDSNVWMATARGLMRLTRQGAFEQDKQAEPATAVFEDREGNIWVGRRRSFERWHDRVFVTYTSAGMDGLENSGPVYADTSGRVWTGRSIGGLFWLRGNDHGELTNAGIGRDVVYSIDGATGELWIGRQRGGLTHLIASGESVTSESFTAADGLAAGPVYVVHRCRDGTVWVGTLNGGVSRIRGGKITTYTTANGLASNAVSAIEEGAGGTIWVATAGGLNAFKNDHWCTYSSAQELPSARINCLTEDPGGVLWIGTDVGLALLRNGRLYIPQSSAGSLQEEVYGIVHDGLGYLWISTSKHVLRVPRAKMLEATADAAGLREFGPADGIPSPEGVRRNRGVVKDSAGLIWFSLRRGVSVVDPARINSDSAPAILHLDSVLADGNTVSTEKALRIPARNLRVRFDFVGLSLSVPERVRYRYRLDGLDHDWSEPTSERYASYMNLAPGPYKFRVIASNSAGSWNGAEFSIGMEVLPSLSQMWQFQVALVLAAVLAGFALYRVRVRRLTKELNIGFQERLDERTRIAQELHDTLLQGLLATSIQLNLAVYRVPADSPVRDQFVRPMTMLQQVVGESRNAVKGLRAPGSISVDLETAFSRVREELAVSKSTQFRIVVDGPQRPLNPLIRDQLFRIGREALSNAFRHSGAPRVELEINYGPSALRLTVRDTGRGIDDDVLRSGREGHWGLTGMRECADKIGARLTVMSQRGAGTELDLTLPGRVAYASTETENRRRWFVWRLRGEPKAVRSLRLRYSKAEDDGA